jgi:ABC-type Mn2+/Zn2+ transport system ATPase subunit
VVTDMDNPAPHTSGTAVAAAPPVVTTHDVCVHYGSVLALAPATLEFPAGQSVSLVGPNGSGKSTLLLVLAGLLKPTSGSVSRRDGLRVSFVAQHQEQHRWMPLGVRDVLRMGRYGERGLLGRLGPDDRAAIDAGVERMDIGSLLRKPFGSLSGGQRQRVLVAQALAARPQLLLLDEPITGLDLVSQQLILDVVTGEAAAGTTVVLSTHHLGEARRTDRVLLLAGCILADGPPADVLSPALLAEAFGNRMVPAGDGANSVLVIDDHGHADHEHAPAQDRVVDVAELLPHHHHDHSHSHTSSDTSH